MVADFRKHPAFLPLKGFLGKTPVLFHGTRFAKAINHSGKLLAPALGDRCVSFSRNPAVAIYMAALERDVDEGEGTVLVIDRNVLSFRHRLYNRCNGFEFREEAEEAVWQDVRLTRGLILAQVQL
jgi:hypothetical protein